MKADVLLIEVQGILPMEQHSVAIFVGNEEKTFMISVNADVGRAIAMSLRGEKSERPLTHELMAHVFSAFDIHVERVVINELRSNTYYARLILRAENEVHKKFIEIDARPSDCLALALQAKAPVYVARDVWEEVEDMSELLDKMKESGGGKKKPDPPEEEPPLFGEDA